MNEYTNTHELTLLEGKTMNKTYMVLEFDKIKQKISDFAINLKTKEKILGIIPEIKLETITTRLNKVTEAKNFIEKSTYLPIPNVDGVEKLFLNIEKDLILSPVELEEIGKLLYATKKLICFMLSCDKSVASISQYATSMFPLDDVREEIEGCIKDGLIDSRASTELEKIRKKIVIFDERIHQKLNNIFSSSQYAPFIQDKTPTQRAGRYVIPVKREYRKNIDGVVHDTSSSGSTVFIEPLAIKTLQDELEQLKMLEKEEEYKILCSLTALISSYGREFKINMEAILHYDFIFAKAKYSKEINGAEPIMKQSGAFIVKNARHPLLGKDAVPFDFKIGNEFSALIITGPNTGGKTVTLKTIGLFSIMAQSALHVPCEDSQIPIFNDVYADIGDGQSIENSLSTFSSHIKNIGEIIKLADNKSLVLLDEVGSGTDPQEGKGIAIAILEALFKKGSTILATTHYSEIKEFAIKTPGFENASMAFDINSLKPLYKLRIGISGESNAFIIALKLGFDRDLIDRAHEITYGKPLDLSKIEEVSVECPIKEVSFEIIKEVKKIEEDISRPKFKVGDNVYISTIHRNGIVRYPEDSRGDYTVLVLGKQIKVNWKRLKLYVAKEELYPDDYDFDIVFESKENRKIRKTMNKKHDNNTVIVEEKVNGYDN